MHHFIDDTTVRRWNWLDLGESII